MAVTKLRADAPPFLFRPCHLRFPPPPPPHCMAPCQYRSAARSPAFTVVPNYPSAPLVFPVPRPIYSIHPPPHPATVPMPHFLHAVPRLTRRKGKPGFLRKVPGSPPPKKTAVKGAFLRKAEPSPAPLSSKEVSSPPPPTSRAPLRPKVALPHGSAPHKLVFIVGDDVDGEKLRAQAAAAAMARAAEPVKPAHEPAPAPAAAAAPRPGKSMAPPCLLRRQQQATARGRSKEVARRQAKAPVEPACKPAARSPSPTFTTRPPATVHAPEWRKRRVTTVMIRNIPNRLKPCEMLQLLDEHCARANSKKKMRPVLAAYDFLYLPMDFSKCSSNMGYAFVNLTTAAAARGLHYALHGARWKVHGSKKVIDIRAARIQGKEALVTHFSGSTFPCHTDEFLPAAFSPPRDGAAGTSAPTGTYVGNRVYYTPAPPQPPPVAPAPNQQHLEWRRVEANKPAPSG